MNLQPVCPSGKPGPGPHAHSSSSLAVATFAALVDGVEKTNRTAVRESVRQLRRLGYAVVLLNPEARR